MSENVIFCYSGTGNCLDMAKTIARELGDTDIILMRREPAVTDVRDAKRVGFVFPCYGGGLPGGVEESLRKIQVGLTAYTFGVCQYAGYMGSGLHKLDSIIPLRYWTAVSHQCTCIWLLPHSAARPPELRRAGFPLERRLKRARCSFPCAGRLPVRGQRRSRARPRRRRAASPAGPSRAAAPCRPGCQRSRARG